MADRKNVRPERGPGVGSAINSTDNASFIDWGDGTFGLADAARLFVKQAGVWVAWNGQISFDSSTIYGGSTAITPLFAPLVASAPGATQVVAAVASKQIRVLSYVLIANGTVNVKFQSHVAPTDLTGLLYLVANTGASSGFSPLGLFQTVAGEALDINLSGGIAVGGHIAYVAV